MGRRKDQKVARGKDSGGPSMMMRLLVLLCVVSSMALVLQLNLTNQHNLMLRNIKGVDEPRAWVAQAAGPTCRPRRHLVFLKTHKCGSSTVQNMLMRFAFAKNLSVALPYSGVYLDGVAEGQSLKVKELKGSPFAPPSGKYHFLIHHTRLHVRSIQQLTYDDSVWVTIVREPSAVFESMFHYYHLHKFYGATFDHLIWKLEGNDGGRFKFKNANNRYSGRLGRNQMTWDLGLDDLDMRQESVLKEAIKILDQSFHLVMIAERMDESLVLFKHLMCWSDEDVVAMSRNVRKDRYRSYLSEHSVTTLEYFNAADVKLYAYFKERFDKQVESFGRGRMEAEVAILRERRDKVWQQCGLQEAAATKRRSHTDVLLHTDKGSHSDKASYTNKGSHADKGPNKGSHAEKGSYSDKGFHSEKGQYLVIQYEVHNNGSYQERRYCKDLVRPSVEFTQLLRWKQYSRYHYNINNPWNLSWSTSFKKKSKRKSRKVPIVTIRRHHQRERHLPQHSRQR